MHSAKGFNPRLFFCPALIVALGGLGCRDSETRKDNLLKHESTLSLNLIADPAEAFQKVDLFITSVEARAGQEWKVLATPDRAFDLQNPAGKEEILAGKVQLPKGAYREVRLKVDAGRSSVVPREGGSLPLVLPPALRDGIVLKTQASPSDSLIHDLILNVDAARSLIRQKQPSDGYTLALSARLVDREAMGVITGRLVDERDRPLKGVQVMAQAGEAEGRTLVRTVKTGADGKFTLDLLPMNQMHYVVAQPRTAEAIHEARASEGFKPTRLDRRHEVNLGPFKAVASHPGPEGEVRGPGAPDQFDEVDLLKELPTGTRTGIFILRSLRTTREPSGAASSFRFEDLPAGPCQVRVRRATLMSSGDSPAWNPVGQHAAEIQPGAARQKVDF
jgi:hypothetical protein